MTLKELTIKRGLRAESALRYLKDVIQSSTSPAEELIDRVSHKLDETIDDITNMITEFEETNHVHDPHNKD